MRFYSFILAVILSLIVSGNAHAAASLVPAYACYSTAGAAKVCAGQVGSNTTELEGATVSKRNGKAVLSVNDPVVDVRKYGAKCDGTSDDAPSINAYIASISPTSPVTVLFPSGKVCAVATSITAKSYVNFAVEGQLKALAGFSGDAVIKASSNVSNYDEHIHISGDGIINANNVVQDGISVKRGRFWKISVRVWGATRYGMRLGDKTAISGSYEIHVTSPQIWRGDYANASGSIGLYHENCTDSAVTGVVAQGYRQGFHTDSGAVHYFGSHAWGRKANGPMTHSFYINGNDVTLTGCDSDTPHNTNPDGSKDGSITNVYGFYLGGYNTFMFGCRSYINPSDPPGVATDNLVTAVAIAQPSGLYGSIYGLRIGGSSSFRHKAAITGSRTGLTVIGVSDDGNVVDTSSLFQTVDAGNPITLAIETLTATNGTVTNLNATNSTVTGYSTVKGSGGYQLAIDTLASDQSADIILKSANSLRWRIRKSNGSETGAAAGSDFRLESMDDSGSYLNTPLWIKRSTGDVIFSSKITAAALSGTAISDSTSTTSSTTAASATAVKAAYDLANGKPSLTNTAPNADGVASAGSGVTAARVDHVHPSDSSKENALGNPAANGYVLSSTTGGVRSWVQQSGGVSSDSPVFTTKITTPKVESNAQDGTHYVQPWNGVAFSDTAADGMIQTNSSGLQWYLSGGWKTAAPTVSPAFSGTPTAPTAAGGTSSTQIATTAFVANAVSAFGSGTIGGSTGSTDNAVLVASGTGGATVKASSASVDPTTGGITTAKQSSVVDVSLLYNDSGTQTTGSGRMGPSGSMAKSYYLRDPNAIPTANQVLVTGTPGDASVKGATASVIQMTAIALSSGPFTPTATAGANTSAVTGLASHYLRVDSEVTVSGSITATYSGTADTLYVDFPIPSNVTATTDCAGAGAAGITGRAINIACDVSGKRALLSWDSSGLAGSGTITYTYTYTVK